MDRQSVPQDASRTYGGLRKLLYAVDENGKYTGVPSSGWEAESFSTELAVAELLRLRDQAWQRARDGNSSALEYHMYRSRMDFDTLVMISGVWRWRVRRHLRPGVFARLSDSMLSRYAEAMGISVAELKHLPASPDA
jgi:hypothetical protein